jgi:hypothetical protein
VLGVLLMRALLLAGVAALSMVSAAHADCVKATPHRRAERHQFFFSATNKNETVELSTDTQGVAQLSIFSTKSDGDNYECLAHR